MNPLGERGASAPCVLKPSLDQPISNVAFITIPSGKFPVVKLKTLLATIGPGILVAATGVGAGDLATATFTGTKLGTAILWAVVVGAVLKYVLNEGLTRWQLATGTTLILAAFSFNG